MNKDKYNKRQIEKRKIVVLEEEKEVDRKSQNQNQSRIRRIVGLFKIEEIKRKE